MKPTRTLELIRTAGGFDARALKRNSKIVGTSHRQCYNRKATCEQVWLKFLSDDGNYRGKILVKDKTESGLEVRFVWPDDYDEKFRRLKI